MEAADCLKPSSQLAAATKQTYLFVNIHERLYRTVVKRYNRGSDPGTFFAAIASIVARCLNAPLIEVLKTNVYHNPHQQPVLNFLASLMAYPDIEAYVPTARLVSQRNC
jgi:hypothetical protein